MKKIIPILSIIILSQNFLYAQINNELKNLINQSFTYFPKVKELDNLISIAKEKVALTALGNSPLVFANGSYNYLNPVAEVNFSTPTGDKLIKFQPNHNFNTSVNGSYTLYDFGKLKANIERAKIDIAVAEHNKDAIQYQLASQVSNIYYNIVYFKKAIAIQDSVIYYLSNNKKIVEAKYNNGDGLKLDILSVQASIDNEANRKLDLENLLQKQVNLLEYTTGKTNATNSNFDFKSNNQSLDTSIEKLAASNSDFISINDKIQQIKLDIASTKLNEKPTIQVNASTGFRNGFAPQVYNFKFNFGAGVSIQVPLYTGGKMKQQVKLQTQQIFQSELAIESLKATYKKDIAQSLSDINTNQQRISNTISQIVQAQYAQKIAATRFVNGVGTNIELINASTNIQRALLTQLQYQYQLCLAKVELARLMGEKYW